MPTDSSRRSASEVHRLWQNLKRRRSTSKAMSDCTSMHWKSEPKTMKSRLHKPASTGQDRARQVDQPRESSLIQRHVTEAPLQILSEPHLATNRMPSFNNSGTGSRTSFSVKTRRSSRKAWNGTRHKTAHLSPRLIRRVRSW